MSGYFDTTYYLEWATRTYSWMTTSASSSSLPPGTESGKKPWLPEGLCVISQLALLNLYPYGYASALEWPKGVKIGFSKHQLDIFPPNLSQKFTRKIWTASKTDLVKLPQAITIGILMQPPSSIPEDINLHERSILDLLKDDTKFDCVTRIYLYALNSLKRLAVTYGYTETKLSSRIDEVIDPVELKFLKQSYHLLHSALRGQLPTGYNLPEIGQKARDSWQEEDFREIDRHIGLGLKEENWQSENAEAERHHVMNTVNTKVRFYKDLCEETCLALKPTDNTNSPPTLSGSALPPLPRRISEPQVVGIEVGGYSHSLDGSD